MTRIQVASWKQGLFLFNKNLNELENIFSKNIHS